MREPQSTSSGHDLDWTKLVQHGPSSARLFLTGMVKHHQGAITMAEQELANGQNPDAKKLAQAIITAQKAEIDTMNQLLTQL